MDDIQRAIEYLTKEIEYEKRCTLSPLLKGKETIRTQVFKIAISAMHELRNYKKLEERGELLRLPCMVGDTLYFPYIDTVTGEKIISEEPVMKIGLYYKVGNIEGILSSCDEIGKIIFVDKEGAEKALEEMENEPNRF